MSNQITDELLVDYLCRATTPEIRAAIDARLPHDELLQSRLAELNELRKLVAGQPDETVSTLAEDRFATFLAAATAEEQVAQRGPRLRSRNGYRMAALAATILLVFSLGRYFGQREGESVERALLASRSLMLEMMKSNTTSERIQATRVALEATGADPELLDNLGYLLLNDENTNVQLAALSALQRYADEPAVREILLRAIASERPEVVHLQLIETLVGLKEERVIPYLRQLIDNQSLPQHLKDAAQMGTFKLI